MVRNFTGQAKKKQKKRIKDATNEHALYPLTLHQDLLNSFFLPNPARPIRPKPKSSIVEDSGTETEKPASAS